MNIRYVKCFAYSLGNQLKYEVGSPLCDLVHGLRVEVDKRFSKIYNFSDFWFDPLYIISAALDPATAGQLTPTESGYVTSQLIPIVRIYHRTEGNI